MAVDGLPVLFTRKYRASSDRAYVCSSWLYTMRDAFVANDRHAPPVNVRVEKPIFEYGQSRRIDRLLDDPTTRIILQVTTEDMDAIVGWAVARGDCLHYVFVRPAFRRQGIARHLIAALFPHGVKRFSTRTPKGDSFIVSRHVNALYDPFAIDPRTDP